MESLFDTAVNLLMQGRSFVWAVIVSQDGSTPRGRGARMIVTPGETFGTIGGGGMEGQATDIARSRVLPTGAPEIVRYCLRASDAAVSEFICGGDCEILLARISAGDEDALSVFRAARDAEKAGREAWLFYIVNENRDPAFEILVNVAGREVFGRLSAKSEALSLDMLYSPIRASVHGESVDGLRYFVDEVHAGGRMLLFGGGHVSREVAALAVSAGFQVTVVDDRADYACPARFPHCQTALIESFDQMPDFETDENTWLLIITRGHLHDKTVLRWALSKPCRYLGMIGGKTKRDLMYRELEASGIPMEKLRRVHCPIGLSIGAETPVEIAVSILAEIIQLRRGKR